MKAKQIIYQDEFVLIIDNSIFFRGNYVDSFYFPIIFNLNDDNKIQKYIQETVIRIKEEYSNQAGTKEYWWEGERIRPWMYLRNEIPNPEFEVYLRQRKFDEENLEWKFNNLGPAPLSGWG